METIFENDFIRFSEQVNTRFFVALGDSFPHPFGGFGARWNGS
jgi:hypothetical protein